MCPGAAILDAKKGLSEKLSKPLMAEVVLGAPVRKRDEGDPSLVAGREVVGRAISVWWDKQLEWVKGVVKEFDAVSGNHKIRFNTRENKEEKWLCLGRNRWSWLEDTPPKQAPNPTHGTGPVKDDAVGRKVKVFWPAMGRWYLGRVQSYDKACGQHEVVYKDGDIQKLALRNEAVLWVAGKPHKPGSRRRPAAAVKSPETAANGASKVVKSQSGSKRSHNSCEGGEEQGSAGAMANGEQQQQQGGGRAKKGRTIGHQDSNTTGEKVAKSAEERTSGNSPSDLEAHSPRTRPDAVAASEAHCRSSSGVPPAGEDALSVASSSVSSEGGSGEDAAAEAHSTQYSDDRGASASAAPVSGSGRQGGGAPQPPKPKGIIKRSQADSACQGEGKAPVRRSKLPTLRITLGPPPKHRLGGSGGVGSPPRGLKGAEQDPNSPGARVVGARVGILWPEDEAYYKGTLVAYDAAHKRSKIRYDDGEQEWLVLGRERFQWAAPRAASAGNNPALRAAMRDLGAVGLASERPPIPAAHVSPAAPVVPAPPMAHAPAQPSALSAPGAAGQLPMRDAPYIGGSRAPQGDAAIGCRLLLPFEGTTYMAEVLAYDREEGRYHVLYEDGEDEWLEPAAEAGLTWLGPSRGSQPMSAGLPKGEALPKGRAAVGWRVAVYWKDDMKFYGGELVHYDGATGRHQILYDDDEREYISLSSEKVKWVLPPGVSGSAEEAAKKPSRRGGQGRREDESNGGAEWLPPTLARGLHGGEHGQLRRVRVGGGGPQRWDSVQASCPLGSPVSQRHTSLNGWYNAFERVASLGGPDTGRSLARAESLTREVTSLSRSLGARLNSLTRRKSLRVQILSTPVPGGALAADATPQSQPMLGAAAAAATERAGSAELQALKLSPRASAEVDALLARAQSLDDMLLRVAQAERALSGGLTSYPASPHLTPTAAAASAAAASAATQSTLIATATALLHATEPNAGAPSTIVPAAAATQVQVPDADRHPSGELAGGPLVGVLATFAQNQTLASPTPPAAADAGKPLGAAASGQLSVPPAPLGAIAAGVEKDVKSGGASALAGGKTAGDSGVSMGALKCMLRQASSLQPGSIGLPDTPSLGDDRPALPSLPSNKSGPLDPDSSASIGNCTEDPGLGSGNPGLTRLTRDNSARSLGGADSSLKRDAAEKEKHADGCAPQVAPPAAALAGVVH